jgi:serine/threonine protein kinase HipA of HipAB toxin-antitoxin module
LCEHVALEVIRDAGAAPAAASRLHDNQGWRFLEVTRFDRVGPRGRVGVRSLEAVKIEAMISARGWTEAVDALARGVRPRIGHEDASRVRWLEAFGSLTGNGDRHDGNLSFLRDASGALSLAPAYDTAPMALAPVATGVLDDSWVPEPPLPTALAEWQRAVPAALDYWEQLSRERRLDVRLRQHARKGRSAVERLASRLFPQLRVRGGSGCQ